VELTIEKLVYGGDGLARVAGPDGRRKTVFVPLVLPGERVDVTVVDERPGFARARLDRVITPAPERTSPPCPYFGECGGCHYQHATYDAQLRYKANILQETVERIAKIKLPEIVTHASPPLNYRNRTRMKVSPLSSGDTRFAIGYYRLASHSLLPVKECPISSPLINRAIQAVWSMAATHELPKGMSEIEFFSDHDDRSLLIELLTDPGSDERQLPEFAKQLKTTLPDIAGIASIPRNPTALPNDTVAAPELEPSSPGTPLMLADHGSLQYKVGEFSYRVSAGAFFQTNRFIIEKLLDLVTAKASGKLGLDLYAGVGLFTLPLAKSFERVTAVESSPASFRDLVANAPATVKAIESTTELFLENFRGSKPDYVVVDPPRAGLGKRVIKGLAKLSPKQIAYVSCDPSTLSRDLLALAAAGYRVTQAHLVDLFPQTFHIESVLRLER
jgi:23S rRNA (uracil1939-C5)-methyltransferase